MGQEWSADLHSTAFARLDAEIAPAAAAAAGGLGRIERVAGHADLLVEEPRFGLGETSHEVTQTGSR